MSAIGKTFVHDHEHFVVKLIGHDHYICVSLRDKRSWRFGFDEIRRILRKKK